MAYAKDGQPWSEADVNNLKQMVTENTPTPLIATKLGRTEDSVRSKAHAEGISLAPVNRSPAD